MKLGVLFSGGKDSNYAVDLAKEKGWDVFGVDVSVYGTGFAKEKFGINCFAEVLSNINII